MIAVHHLAAYNGPYAGSFIPMLTASAREAERRGLATTVWLRPDQRTRGWVPQLAEVTRLRWLPADDGTSGDLRRVAAAVRRAIAHESGEVVLHSHFSAFDLAAALVALTRRRTAVFWHEHGRPPDGSRAQIRSMVKYGVFGRKVDRILCVNSQIADDVLERHAPRHAVVTFLNAIDVDRFPAITPQARTHARAALGLDMTTRVVLHFGWDWLRKGGDLMIGAARRMQECPDLLWITVPGIPETVTEPPSTVRGLQPRDDPRALYAAADVVLSCSRSEGGPFTLLEALAGGLPAVATDLPPQRLALAGLPGGEVVELDPSAVASGVRRLLSLDDRQRAHHAEMARTRIVSDYSLANWARRLVDLYETTTTDHL